MRVCVYIRSSLKWDHLAGHFLMGSVQILIGLPRWVSGKESPANAGNTGDADSIPESGKSPGGGHGNSLQCSCLGNPMDKEPGGLQSMGSQRVRHDWVTEHTHTDLQILLSSLGEGGHYRTCLGLQSLLRTKSFFKITKYLFLSMPAVLQNKSWSLPWFPLSFWMNHLQDKWFPDLLYIKYFM